MNEVVCKCLHELLRLRAELKQVPGDKDQHRSQTTLTPLAAASFPHQLL